MNEGRGFFKGALLASIAIFASTPLVAEEIPIASPEEVGMSSERLLQINTVVQRYVSSGEIQGAVTAVTRRGKVVHFETHGRMDVDGDRAMNKDTIFRMASSSKPVLGVAAMMMVEKGLFDPADEVAKYIPEFKDMQVAVLKEPADKDVSPKLVYYGEVPEHRFVPAQRAITIHDLLTHTAGLATYGLGLAVSKVPEPGPESTLASRVPLYGSMALDFQPGARWAYSPGVGLDVVARIIEIVSGMPYDELLRTRIFEPLGMTDTAFNLTPEQQSRRVVIDRAQYLKPKGSNPDVATRYFSASVGLSSTTEDFLRFEQMLVNGGTLFGHRLLRPESIATMTSNQVGELYQGKGKRFGYTVAVMLDPSATGSSRGIGAFGWGGMFGTVSWSDPSEQITAVLMVQQGSDGLVKEFEKAIRDAIVD